MSSFKGEMVIMDGLQRITAILSFINNEIPVFGIYNNQFEDRIRMSGVTLSININDLKTKKGHKLEAPHTITWISKVAKFFNDSEGLLSEEDGVSKLERLST